MLSFFCMSPPFLSVCPKNGFIGGYEDKKRKCATQVSVEIYFLRKHSWF